MPIHKKDSKFEYSTYKTISLLPNINKVLEQLMHSRLMKFLLSQKFIKYQVKINVCNIDIWYASDRAQGQHVF